MVENVSANMNAPAQLAGLDPSTPQPQKLVQRESPDDETPRNRRRREWHTAKIEGRRATKRSHPSTASVDPGSLAGLIAETQDAPPGAYREYAADLRDSRPHNRTPSQWKTIQELKLCASCLTRTIPPHRPTDKRAPCKDRPSVPFEEADIASIRKELARQVPEGRRKGSAKRPLRHSDGRRQQVHHAKDPSHSDKGTNPQHLGLNIQYDCANHSRYGKPHSHESEAGYGGPVSFAPLYNFQDPNSLSPLRTASSVHSSPKEHQEVGSQSSVTLSHHEWPDSVAVSHQRGSKELASFDTRSATPPRQSVELDINMMGMTPATPLTSGIPEIHIEGESGSPCVTSRRTGRPLNSDIRDLMPPTPNNYRDWDSSTNVAEGQEPKKLESTVGDDLSSSKDLVEKLIGEVDAIVLSVDRSWTLQGPPHNLEWDDATMVEEPYELSAKFDFFPDKVLRSTQSAESFFVSRQGTF